MIFAAVIALKITLPFGAVWLASRFVKSAAWRHRLWTLAVCCALALPAAAFLVPGWRPPVDKLPAWSAAVRAAEGMARDPLPTMTVNAVMPRGALSNPAVLLLGVYLAGALVFSIRLLAGVGSLAWVSRRSPMLLDRRWMTAAAELSTRLELQRHPRLLLASGRAMPMTWGIFHPKILLPAEAETWSEERMRVVLAHEMAHIERVDWLWQIAGELLRAIYWFHPLAWIAASRLRRESECATDDEVLNSGIAATRYASELLEIARDFRSANTGWSTALAMARPTNLERRFTTMLNPKIDRRRVSRTASLATTLATVCLLVPLAALQAPAQERSGRFGGTIFDPRNAVVPNATIVLANVNGETRDITTSDSIGAFSFEGLPAGTYEMRVLHAGFRPFVDSQVVLISGRDFTRNAALAMGAVNERIEVTAEGGLQPLKKATGGPIRVGGNVSAANLIVKVPPVYPASAKAARIQGAVLLQAEIQADGTVGSLRVMNSQIDPDLARSAVDGVKQWRYRPTMLNGEPVAVETAITVNFTLAQ